MKFLIGYEWDTGSPIEAELHHLFISGVTQHSGKTTSLEAFLSRVGHRAIVFRSGRGEIGFEGARRIPPFFRERTDWRFVEGMLSAHLREKVKFYRGDIMKACRGASTLADVHENVRKVLKKLRSGTFVEKIYVELDQYFSEALPELEKLRLSPTLDLANGLNMVDLEGVPVAVQQLIIASCADRIMKHERNTILVVPEAWQMVPLERPSPVKLAVEDMTRQGAKIGNYVWLDSQQVTGLELDILRNVDIWMFGRQTLDREKERVAKAIPGRKVTTDDVHHLRVGQFYVVQYGEKVQLAYVCPAWLPEDEARRVALGKVKIAEAAKQKPVVIERALEEEMYREKYEELVREVERLHQELAAKGKETADLERRLAEKEAGLKGAASDAFEEGRRKPDAPDTPETVAEKAKSARKVMERAASVIGGDEPPVHLEVTRELPDLVVKVDRPTVRATDEEHRGRVATLLHDGFFDAPRTHGEVVKELISRGWGKSSGGLNVAVYRELEWFSAKAFLRQEGEKGSRRWAALARSKGRVEMSS